MSRITYLSIKTHYSNPDSIKSSIDRSPSRPEDYLEIRHESNVVFSENGNIYNWTEKHNLAHKNGMKYVHSATINVTNDLTRGVNSPNFKFNLIAKNYEAVKELNRLVGLSFEGRGTDEERPHFYFEPRISLKELVGVSKDIIVVAEPILNPFWQLTQSNMIKEMELWGNELEKISDRLWLSISSRVDREQRFASKVMLDVSETYGFGLLYMDSIYSHCEEYEAVRHVLNLSQNERYEADDSQRYLKDYETIVNSINSTKVFDVDAVKELIENANKLFDSVESFELNTDIKYPHVANNPLFEIQKRIAEGYNERKLNQLPQDEQVVYKERIRHELAVMTKVDAIDYLLLEYEIKSDMRKHNIYPGPGRGSVGGSLIAYLLQITSVDPIKHNLLFERFINEDRIDVQDVDSDYAPNDRNFVQKYLLEHDKYTCTSIITFGTLGIKAGFKEIGKALGYDYNEMNFLTREFPMNGSQAVIPSTVRDSHADIVEYVEKVEGLIVSVGRHAAGIIVSDRDLQSEIGAVKVKDFDYDTSVIDMNEVSRLKYVKLDILGLRNIQHINLAVEMAGLPRMDTTSDYINYNDWNIATDIAKNGADTLFQFDAPNTQIQAMKLFSEETLSRIHENYPNITVIELMSILTAVIRPGSASIMDSVVSGVTRDNGIEALNEILKDSYGWMIYQEQSIAYLKFVGFSGSEADTIRRAIGKKEKAVIEKTVPEIRERSIDIITNEYKMPQEKAEDIIDSFMQIFLDSAMYSFNKSHAIEYSYLTYQTAWLRYYYPLEWITAGMITWSNSLDKVNDYTALAKRRGISVETAKFRYSKGDYFFDKETNTIYQGTAPIKGNNGSVGDMLYRDFKDSQHNSFSEFLLNLKDDTPLELKNNTLKSLYEVYTTYSEDELKELDKNLKKYDVDSGDSDVYWLHETKPHTINKTQLISLIRLGYFSEFGGAKKLEKVWNKFDSSYKPNNKTLANKGKKFLEVYKYEQSLEDEDNTVFDQCLYELEYLKRVEVQNTNINPKFAFVVEITRSNRSQTQALIHLIHRGQTVPCKIGAKLYRTIDFQSGDIIEIVQAVIKPRPLKIDGEWGEDPVKKDLWIVDAKSIRKRNRSK